MKPKPSKVKTSLNPPEVIERKFRISVMVKDIVAVEIDRFQGGDPKRLRVLEVPKITGTVLQPFEYYNLTELSPESESKL
jgi:hypothetical protein